MGIESSPGRMQPHRAGKQIGIGEVQDQLKGRSRRQEALLEEHNAAVRARIGHSSALP